MERVRTSMVRYQWGTDQPEGAGSGSGYVKTVRRESGNPSPGRKGVFCFIIPYACPVWNGQLVGKSLDLLDDFLGEVPVIRLSCPPGCRFCGSAGTGVEEI